MSRIGKHPVPVPQGVEATVNGQEVHVKGKLGQLDLVVHNEIAVKQADGEIAVEPRSNSKLATTLWATTRTLINNMVVGVSEGFEKKLEINGVGYRAQVQGKELVMQLGFSHEVRYPIPEGIQIKCEKPTEVTISGYDRKLVGQVASEIRGWRPPEPFKGKGVKYANEQILRKEGKKK
jgi:large subunit ribosomal protein L6